MKKIKEGQKQNCSCGIYSKDRVHSPSICFPNPSPKKECPRCGSEAIAVKRDGYWFVVYVQICLSWLNPPRRHVNVKNLPGGGINAHGCQIHTVYVDSRILAEMLPSKSKESPKNPDMDYERGFGHCTLCDDWHSLDKWPHKSMLHKSVEDKTWEEIIDNLPRDKAEIIYFSRHGIKKLISDLLLKQREEALKELSKYKCGEHKKLKDILKGLKKE